jgi:hypothetical protein
MPSEFGLFLLRSSMNMLFSILCGDGEFKIVCFETDFSQVSTYIFFTVGVPHGLSCKQR